MLFLAGCNVLEGFFWVEALESLWFERTLPRCGIRNAPCGSSRCFTTCSLRQGKGWPVWRSKKQAVRYKITFPKWTQSLCFLGFTEPLTSYIICSRRLRELNCWFKNHQNSIWAAKNISFCWFWMDRFHLQSHHFTNRSTSQVPSPLAGEGGEVGSF